MTFKEFLKFRQNCIFCNKQNMLILAGTLREKIGDGEVQGICTYADPVIRKNFLTFYASNFHPISLGHGFDIQTLNTNKYKNFSIIDNNGCFDIDFRYTMRVNFRVFCPNNHYGYNSRIIKISNISPDITRGYDVKTENITYNKYHMTFNKIENKLSIDTGEDEPRVLPYIDIESFPKNGEGLLKKIENILLLS